MQVTNKGNNITTEMFLLVSHDVCYSIRQLDVTLFSVMLAKLTASPDLSSSYLCRFQLLLVLPYHRSIPHPIRSYIKT